MPNWVRNKVKFSNRGKEILDKVIVVNGDKEELMAEDVLFDFNKILEMPKTFTWYDWCIENWGTKWNACNTYVVSDNEVEFDTAWSCPINIFIELSKQFSDVEIEVEYADEDIGYNCGKLVFLNGNIEECIDMDNNTDFALDVWGYTEEMKEEYYEEIGY